MKIRTLEKHVDELDGGRFMYLLQVRERDGWTYMGFEDLTPEQPIFNKQFRLYFKKDES